MATKPLDQSRITQCMDRPDYEMCRSLMQTDLPSPKLQDFDSKSLRAWRGLWEQEAREAAERRSQRSFATEYLRRANWWGWNSLEWNAWLSDLYERQEEAGEKYQPEHPREPMLQTFGEWRMLNLRAPEHKCVSQINILEIFHQRHWSKGEVLPPEAEEFLHNLDTAGKRY